MTIHKIRGYAALAVFSIIGLPLIIPMLLMMLFQSLADGIDWVMDGRSFTEWNLKLATRTASFVKGEPF